MRGCTCTPPPRGRVTTVGCAFEPTRRSTNSPASEPKTSAVLPWLFTKALREKNRRVPSTPPGTFQLNTCPAMPLRWLRRLRGGGKALAPLRTHQPETRHPATLLEGECDPGKPLNQGRRPPRGLPRRLRRAREPPSHPEAGQRATGSLSGPTPRIALPPLGTRGQQPRVISMQGGGKRDRVAGRLKAGRPNLESGSATAHTLQRHDRPPRAPLPWPRKNFLRHYQTVFADM